MSQKVLSYDLGGTKVAAGVVNARGKVLEEIREAALFSEGKEMVLNQLVLLGQQLLKKHKGITRVGVASAGPLDPVRGILLDPTNYASAKGTWGKVPITKILSKKLKRKVYLENDAAAAILAEHWIGRAKGYDDAMILTLGTGLGTGIICNGKLIRSGRGLHPEAGHIIVHMNDQSAPCGCGNLGCSEAFLSGRNFNRRARQRFANPNLTAKDIADLARKRDPRALAAFDEYSQIMAIAIHNYCRIFSPKIVVFAGSFAATADLFIDSTRKRLEIHLERNRNGVDLMPHLAVSSLDNQSGLIGSAFVALNRK